MFVTTAKQGGKWNETLKALRKNWELGYSTMFVTAKFEKFETVKMYGEEKKCCVKAIRLPCVCEVSWICAVHGERHFGSHE